MSMDSYSESSGADTRSDIDSEGNTNLWQGEEGGDISGYARELISMLDPGQTLSGVNLNEESSVRRFMGESRRDSVINTIIRLRKLKKHMASIFPVAEVQCIDQKLARCMSAMNMDKSHIEALVLINERHQVLDKMVDEGLLLEQEDNEIFKMFVNSQVKLIQSNK
jgi:hypothetical protein